MTTEEVRAYWPALARELEAHGWANRRIVTAGWRVKGDAHGVTLEAPDGYRHTVWAPAVTLDAKEADGRRSVAVVRCG